MHRRLRIASSVPWPIRAFIDGCAAAATPGLAQPMHHTGWSHDHRRHRREGLGIPPDTAIMLRWPWPRRGDTVKLTVREAARLLAVSEREVYRWVDDGDIPCHLVNHQPLFSRAELLEWATARRLPLSPELFDDGEASSSLATALERGGVHAHVSGTDREAVLRSVVARLPIADAGERDLVLSVMLAREHEASTGIGDGIAIPHVRRPLVFAGSPAVVTTCYLEHRVPLDAPGGEPIHILFAIMTPTIRAHLQLLSRLSLALHDPGFKTALTNHAPIGDLLVHVRRIEAALARSSELRSTHGKDGSVG
jgi:PTS system nitrogen regulatory IIA component